MNSEGAVEMHASIANACYLDPTLHAVSYTPCPMCHTKIQVDRTTNACRSHEAHLVILISKGTVVFGANGLQRLHQTSLDVPRLGGLHRRIDETLSPAHSVEEKLLSILIGSTKVWFKEVPPQTFPTRFQLVKFASVQSG